MGKSKSGPDWVDVMAYVRALDEVHGCKTGITITESILRAPYGTVAIMTSVWDTLPGSAEPLQVVTEKELSITDTLDLAVVVYNGLYQHDWAVQMRYKPTSWEKSADT